MSAWSVALVTSLRFALATLAVASALAGKWVIAASAAALAAWMGSFAWAGLRRMRA